MPKFNFHIHFFTLKIIGIFLNFFYIEEYQFRSTFFVFWYFWITSMFYSLYFLICCPIFDSSPSYQFAKFNIILWVCQFFSKNPSDFVSPAWKLDNPYYHNVYLEVIAHHQLLTPVNSYATNLLTLKFVTVLTSKYMKAKARENKQKCWFSTQICCIDSIRYFWSFTW